MKKFTLKTMEAYAELVRLLSGQADMLQENVFFWNLVREDCYVCDDRELVIIFSAEHKYPVIKMFEVIGSDKTKKTINKDVINSIIGYACCKGIELKYDKYLHINK